MLFKNLISTLLCSLFLISTANASTIHVSSSEHADRYERFLNNRTAPHKNVRGVILQQYTAWRGTRYRYGGTTHRGIDCSALMQEIFSTSLNTVLPRTTGSMIRHGVAVGHNQLKPGDLVFFMTAPSTRHVGVYVGNNQFIHASKIRGVTISDLHNTYWASHYETARRVVPQ